MIERERERERERGAERMMRKWGSEDHVSLGHKMKKFRRDNELGKMHALSETNVWANT